jgi:hypothetical protein
LFLRRVEIRYCRGLLIGGDRLQKRQPHFGVSRNGREFSVMVRSLAVLGREFGLRLEHALLVTDARGIERIAIRAASEAAVKNISKFIGRSCHMLFVDFAQAGRRPLPSLPEIGMVLDDDGRSLGSGLFLCLGVT